LSESSEGLRTLSTVSAAIRVQIALSLSAAKMPIAGPNSGRMDVERNSQIGRVISAIGRA